MELLNIHAQKAEILFSYDELLILNSVFNEVCNGIDVFEFETRIGASKEDVSHLLKKVGNILDKLESK